MLLLTKATCPTYYIIEMILKMIPGPKITKSYLVTTQFTFTFNPNTENVNNLARK